MAKNINQINERGKTQGALIQKLKKGFILQGNFYYLFN